MSDGGAALVRVAPEVARRSHSEGPEDLTAHEVVHAHAGYRLDHLL